LCCAIWWDIEAPSGDGDADDDDSAAVREEGDGEGEGDDDIVRGRLEGDVAVVVVVVVVVENAAGDAVRDDVEGSCGVLLVTIWMGSNIDCFFRFFHWASSRLDRFEAAVSLFWYIYKNSDEWLVKWEKVCKRDGDLDEMYRCTTKRRWR